MVKAASEIFTKQNRNKTARKTRCKNIHKKKKKRSVRKTSFEMLPEPIKQLRPKHFRYADYDYVSKKAQQYGLKSQRQYRIFVKFYQPGGFPSAPERIYNEWVDWNTFLNSSTRFYGHDTPCKLIPYWDAVAKIHSFNFTSSEKYRQAWDEGLIPDGIPKNPEKRYYNFIKNGGWNSFLGKSMISKINAQQQVQQACALAYTKGQSPNILSLLVASGGVTELKEKLDEAEHLQPVKIYNWYPENSQDIISLLDVLGNKQAEYTWLFHNPNEVFYELQGILEPLSY